MPKLKHYDGEGTARFITLCCYRQMKYLSDPKAAELFMAKLDSMRRAYSIKILAYVIMPEHAHLVLLPSDNVKLGLVIGETKSRMAREYFAKINADNRGPNVFWQKRCYDHNCRFADVVREKINYCHNNPVKRDLVTEPGEYIWSSYNWYMGKRDVPLEIDGFEM
jgi:putative transposase